MPTITTKNVDGSTSHRLIHGQKLTITRHPDVDENDVPGSIVEAAVQTLNALADKTHSVSTDPTLSHVGRWRALAPLQSDSLKKLALLHGQLVHFESALDQRMKDHLAVALLSPSAFVAALEDAEVRSWWKCADADAKATVLRSAGTDIQCERTILALLRSPLPLAVNAEAQVVAKTWAAVRNAADPAVHEKIEGEKLSLEWGKLNLFVVASVVHQLVLTHSEGGKPAALRILEEDPDPRVNLGAYIYGYQASEIAHMQRVVSVERLTTR